MMNAWGVEKCLDRLDEITEKLWNEAHERRWWKFTRYFPYSFAVLRTGVKSAILRADSEEMTMSDCLSAAPGLSPAEIVRLVETNPPRPVAVGLGHVAQRDRGA